MTATTLAPTTTALLDELVSICWDTYDRGATGDIPTSVLSLLRVGLHRLEDALDSETPGDALGEPLTTALLAHQVVRRWLS